MTGVGLAAYLERRGWNPGTVDAVLTGDMRDITAACLGRRDNIEHLADDVARWADATGDTEWAQAAAYIHGVNRQDNDHA